MVRKINLFLDRRPDKNGYCRVYLQLNHQSGKRKYSIGNDVKVLPKSWDEKAQRIKGTSKEVMEMNKHLSHYHTTAEQTKNRVIAESGRTVSIDTIWNAILSSFKAKTHNGDISLQSIVEHMIATRKDIKKMVIYHAFISNLEGMEKHYGKTYYLSSIGREFYEDFRYYYLYVRGNDNSSFNVTLMALQTAIAWLKKNKWFESNSITVPEYHFPKLKTVTQVEYIKEHEIKLLYNSCFIRLSKTHNRMVEFKRLNKMRDIYVFLCYTGIRSSDYRNLKKEQIQSRTTKSGQTYYVLRLTQVKTSQPVEVPLNEVCMEILRRYNYNLPKRLTSQMSTDIKDMLRLSTFFDDVKEKVTLRDKMQVRELLPRYELLTVHTARHTFAMYLIKKGINIKKVQQLLGHSMLSTTMRYLHEFEKEDVHEEALTVLNN
jgi:integrase